MMSYQHPAWGKNRELADNLLSKYPYSVSFSRFGDPTAPGVMQFLVIDSAGRIPFPKHVEWFFRTAEDLEKFVEYRSEVFEWDFPGHKHPVLLPGQPFAS